MTFDVDNIQRISTDVWDAVRKHNPDLADALTALVPVVRLLLQECTPDPFHRDALARAWCLNITMRDINKLTAKDFDDAYAPRN
jgi:hypothetical protein